MSEHAGGTEVRILLDDEAGGVHAGIVGDGRGFDRAESMTIRGLRTASGEMRERAELAHGRLDVESARGRGTTIDL